jgi:hypothetical protein
MYNKECIAGKINCNCIFNYIAPRERDGEREISGRMKRNSKRKAVDVGWDVDPGDAGTERVVHE